MRARKAPEAQYVVECADWRTPPTSRDQAERLADRANVDGLCGHPHTVVPYTGQETGSLIPDWAE